VEGAHVVGLSGTVAQPFDPLVERGLEMAHAAGGEHDQDPALDAGEQGSGGALCIQTGRNLSLSLHPADPGTDPLLPATTRRSCRGRRWSWTAALWAHACADRSRVAT
jgi:hypothetical protein